MGQRGEGAYFRDNPVLELYCTLRYADGDDVQADIPGDHAGIPESSSGSTIKKPVGVLLVSTGIHPMHMRMYTRTYVTFTGS